MKLLMVIDPVVPISRYQSAGSTNAAVNLAIELCNRGYDITLAGNWDDLSYTVFIPSSIKHLNIFSPDRTYMKKAFQIINEWLSVNQYDIISIQVSTPSAIKYINKLSNKNNAKVYFTMHSWTGTTAVSYYNKNDFIESINNNTCNYIFLSNNQMKTLFNNIGIDYNDYPDRYNVVHNAVKSENYNITDIYAKNIQRKYSIPESFIKEGYYITVSRLVRSKHPYDVIRSCLLKNLKLVLIGKEWINDIDYAKSVKELIYSNTNNIYYIEETTNEEAVALMKEAKATILFTDIEVCNLTILESSLVGTPVVVGPRSTGVGESIDNLRSNGGYVQEIDLPKRVSWDKKYLSLADQIVEAGNHRYDVSKFPDCYKWNNYINSMMQIFS